MYQRFPVDLFVDRFVSVLFACVKSDPATLLTVALLLFLRSLAALLASLFDVAMSFNLLLQDRADLSSRRTGCPVWGSLQYYSITGQFEHSLKASRLFGAYPSAVVLRYFRPLCEATTIRMYIEAIQLARRSSGTASAEDLGLWSRWALAEADRIDPSIGGRFLSAMQDEHDAKQ